MCFVFVPSSITAAKQFEINHVFVIATPAASVVTVALWPAETEVCFSYLKSESMLHISVGFGVL